jgi:hypothetical protein
MMRTINPAVQVYHRLETGTVGQSPATAALQVSSKEIWGKGHKIGGAFPSVQAYWGPLPPGRNGVEFMTNIAPTHPNPSKAIWIHGYDPGIALRRQGLDDFAALPVVTISKVPP